MTRYALLLLALSAVAVPVNAAPVAANSTSVVTAEQKLLKALQGIEEKDSEDFYNAALTVLETTGDETLFYPMMLTAATKGNAAAQTWVATFNLPTTDSDSAEYKAIMKQVDAAAAKNYAPALILAAQLRAQTDADAATSLLMKACLAGSSKAKALYLLQSGRIASGDFSLPEIQSELKKQNHYLEELLGSVTALAGKEAEALDWMLKAEAHGSATAAYMLLSVNVPGETQEDYLKHLHLAVERHHLMAMYTYGALLCRADEHPAAQQLGIKKDVQQGRKLLQLASMLGSAESATDLAMFYIQGLFDSVPAERIYRLFEYGHRCGVAEGSAGVGYCKVLGAGCEQDVQKGLEMMLAARDAGALWVNQALASIYFNGSGGIAPDMRKAVDYLMADVVSGGTYSYAVMAAITALGNAQQGPNANTAKVYLELAKEPNPAHDAATQIQRAEKMQTVYDAIVSSGTWCFAPELEKAAKKK